MVNNLIVIIGFQKRVEELGYAITGGFAALCISYSEVAQAKLISLKCLHLPRISCTRTFCGLVKRHILGATLKFVIYDILLTMSCYILSATSWKTTQV